MVAAVRLGKFLAGAGVASRRASEELIRAGRVTVGGVVVEDPARDVTEADAVAVDGRALRAEQTRVVYALNKPAGVVSTASDPQGRPTIVGLMTGSRRLYPVGRLDVDATGLILLTDDGELAYRLTHPSFEVDKTYRVVVARAPVRERALRALRDGIVLDDGPTAPARARRLAPDTIELTIHEGRKRQVKRMCEAVGHPVIRLERVRFGPLQLGDLAPGKHRRLTAAEISLLRSAGSGAGSGDRRGAARSSSAPRRSARGSGAAAGRRAGAGS
jgi:23S rRNA pseudouridine2605 synthase